MKGDGMDDKIDAPPPAISKEEDVAEDTFEFKTPKEVLPSIREEVVVEDTFEFKTPREMLPSIREEVQTYIDAQMTNFSAGLLDEVVIKVPQRFRDNPGTFAVAVSKLRDAGWYVRLLIDGDGKLTVLEKFERLQHIVVSPSTGDGDVFSLWRDSHQKYTNGWHEQDHDLYYATVRTLLDWRHKQKEQEIQSCLFPISDEKKDGEGSWCVLV